MMSDSHPELLPPVNSDDFLPPISKWTTLGGLLLVGTLGAAVALAAFTKYNITVKATATVRPSGEVRIVQAAHQGTIESIAVAENQDVKQGDIIATIDDSQLKTKKNQLAGNIQQHQLQLAQITAQLNSLNSQIMAEKRASERSVASAQADLSLNQRDYQQRQATTIAEVQEAEANLKLALAEWQKAEEELQKEQANLLSVEANLRSVETNLKSAITKRDRHQPLAESGAISLDRLEETELAVQQQEQAVRGQKAAVEAQKKAIAGQVQTIQKQKQAVEVARSQLEKVKAALNPSAASVTISQERIAQEKAKGEATLATLQKERETLIQQQIEIQNQINRDRQEFAQIDTELQKTIVRAPSDGKILQLNLRNPGQTVQLGDSIAQITPTNASILVKARVYSENIGKIVIGQKSLMRVSAYPYPDYGILEGTVTAISPDVIFDRNNNAPYYEVTIQPQLTYLVKNEKQYSIELGMEITADIVTKEDTVLNFVLRKARLLTDL